MPGPSRKPVRRTIWSGFDHSGPNPHSWTEAEADAEEDILRVPNELRNGRLFVPQGKLAIGDRPNVQLQAILGSCVAVCLHDAVSRRGAMNHVFRAVGRGPLGGAAVVADVERLVNALMRAGTRRSEMTASICGGAHLLEHGRDHGSAIAQTCLDYLAKEKIPILQSSVGGDRARYVRFGPYDGAVEVSYPGRSVSEDLQKDRLHPGMPSNDTEFF